MSSAQGAQEQEDGSPWGFLSHQHKHCREMLQGCPAPRIERQQITDRAQARPPAGLTANGNLQQQREACKLNNSSQQSPSRGLSQLEHKLILCSRQNPRGLVWTRENPSALPAVILSHPAAALGTAQHLPSLPQSLHVPGTVSGLQPQPSPRLRESMKSLQREGNHDILPHGHHPQTSSVGGANN